MAKIKIGTKEFAIGFFVVFALLSLLLFGYRNTSVFLALILISVPFYFHLAYFGFDNSERLALSFFLSLGIFPSLVYLLALLVGSIKISAVMVFVVLLLLGFLLKKFKKA